MIKEDVRSKVVKGNAHCYPLCQLSLYCYVLFTFLSSSVTYIYDLTLISVLVELLTALTTPHLHFLAPLNCQGDQ